MTGSGSWLQVEPAGVVIETVKQAEDGESWIVQLYETEGGAAQARLTFAFPVGQVQEADLLEEPLGQSIPLEKSKVELSFQPFEIKTLQVRL